MQLIYRLFLVVALLILPSFSIAEPLPFNDGRYVTDPALCSLSEDKLLEQLGDAVAFSVRNIKGQSLDNAYETHCRISNVRKRGKSVRFKAHCDAEGETETINGHYRYISRNKFALGKRIFVRCGNKESKDRKSRPIKLAGSGNTQCLLIIDGRTYIRGSCDVTLDSDGSVHFDDQRMKTKCAEFDLGPNRCSMANTVVTRKGTFGGLLITGKDRGHFVWNEGRYLHAHARIEGLRKNGDCWQNLNTTFCVWR